MAMATPQLVQREGRDPRQTESSRTVEERLRDALSEGNTELFKSLLTHAEVDINKTDENGYTLLHHSVGDLVATMRILARRPNVNIKNKDGMTPLHLAAKDDYVETVLRLIMHGADVNGEEKENTPLKVAMDANFKTCANLLMVLGADFSCLKEGSEDRQKQSVICKGYGEGNIRFGWGTVWKEFTSIPSCLPRGYQTGTSLLTIRSHGGNFDFFCRRENDVFQNCTERMAQTTLNDDEELVSDVYRYAISGTSDIGCDVRIRLDATKLDEVKHYKKTVFLRIFDRVVNDFDYSLEQNKATVNLPCHGNTVFSTMAVVVRIEPEKIKSSNKEQHFTSEVNNQVKITIPPTGASGPTEYDIAIRNVDPSVLAEEDKTSEIGTSPFCTIRSSQAGATTPDSSSISDLNISNEMTVQMPRPNVVVDPDGTYAMMCPQDTDAENPSSWNAVDHEVRENVVEVNNTPCGVYIVIALRKNMKKLGARIKKMISNLYKSIVKCKVQCHLMGFYQAIKENESTLFGFLVLVVLCKDKQQAIREFSDYVKSSEDALVKINTKTPYTVYCRTEEPDTVPVPVLPIKYEKNPQETKVSFRVKCDGTISVPTVNLYKCPIKKLDENKLKKSIPVICRLESSVSEGKFLSDKFLETIYTTDISPDAWFELGVFLGFKLSHLSRLEECRRTKYRELLIEWRSQYQKNENPELLTRFLQAAKEAALDQKDIRQNLLDEVRKHKDKNPGLRDWFNTVSTEEIPPFNYFSPSEDIFVFRIAQTMCPEELLLMEMGTIEEELSTVKRNHPHIQRVFCKCVENVKHRKCNSDNNKLFDLALKSLKNGGKRFGMETLVCSYVKPWLDCQVGVNETAETLRKILSKYKLL